MWEMTPKADIWSPHLIWKPLHAHWPPPHTHSKKEVTRSKVMKSYYRNNQDMKQNNKLKDIECTPERYAREESLNFNLWIQNELMLISNVNLLLLMVICSNKRKFVYLGMMEVGVAIYFQMTYKKFLCIAHITFL